MYIFLCFQLLILIFKLNHVSVDNSIHKELLNYNICSCINNSNFFLIFQLCLIFVSIMQWSQLKCNIYILYYNYNYIYYIYIYIYIYIYLF